MEHHLSTLSIISYNDVISRFQEEANEAEERQSYHEALNICLETQKHLQDINLARLSAEQILEVRYYHSLVTSRSQFLFDFMQLQGRRFTDALSTLHYKELSLPSSPKPLSQRLSNELGHSSRQLSINIPNMSFVASAEDCEQTEELRTNITTKDPMTQTPEKPHYSGDILHNQQRKTIVNQPIDADMAKLREKLMGCIVMEKPTMKFSDVIGLKDAKNVLKEAVAVPLLYKNAPQGRNAWTGVLLYGPSGVGKTRLIQAVAGETKCTFINVKTEVLISKYHGESEKNITLLFQLARENAPAVVFIDECDSLCGARGDEQTDSTKRIKNKLLEEMNGFESDPNKRIVVIGNTNRPGSLDNAFLRRFPKRVHVDLPDAEDRKHLLRYYIDSYKNTLTEKNIKDLARKTDKYSGADISLLVADAGMVPCREQLQQHDGIEELIAATLPQNDLRDITMGDFKIALSNVKPSNTDAILREIKKYNKDWGKDTDYSDLEEARERAKQDPLFLKFVSGVLQFFSF